MYHSIGIICASDTELEPFFEYLTVLETIEKSLLKFYRCSFCGCEIIAVYSGVCKVNAAIAAQVLTDTFQTDAVINAGTAGGMDRSVQLFDTVVSSQCAYHDVADDILTEFHPWLKTPFFPASPLLLETAKKYSKTSPYPILFGTSVTGEQFIENSSRQKILERFSPLSADMETASIAHVCYANQIPFLSVRSITDTAEHTGIENFDENCAAASRICAEITMGILKLLLEL